MTDSELDLRRQELKEEARRIFDFEPGVRPPLPVLSALVDASGVRKVNEMPEHVLDMAFTYLETVCEIYGLPKKPAVAA